MASKEGLNHLFTASIGWDVSHFFVIIFWAKESIFRVKKQTNLIQWSLPIFQDPDYLANKSLFAGLLLQI